jgi:hypothetical protein
MSEIESLLNGDRVTLSWSAYGSELANPSQFCCEPIVSLAGGRGILRNGIANSHPNIIHQA